jgi:RHS repeat-associated protein
VQLTYDSLSRVLTEVQGSNPLGTTGKTVSYTWDAESNRTKIDYPSGFDANEARDALGRITAITDSSSNTVASFDLYGAGLREKKRTLANGTYTEVAYDGFRRPTDIDHKGSGGTRFAGYAYLWDANDNPLMEKRAHKSGKGDVYSYDKVNRLTKVLRDVDDPAAELATPGTEAYVEKLEYDMDDVFNLTAYKVTPYGGSTTTTSHTTNAMNEYTAVGGVTHTYTDAGSLADDGTYLYKYDGHQHLIEVRRKSDNALIAEYAYDALGLGRRTGKTVGSAVTRYVYAGQQSIEEYDGTSGTASLSRLFVFGERIDQILAMEAPDYGDVDQDSNTSEVLRFSYHTQLIGSVTQVTGPSGSVVESYEYDPYGKPTMRNGAGSVITASAIKNAYLFTARQLDEETGLFYYRARHYSPELRRFIQRDPLEYVDGPNAATYASSRPCARRDPSGTKEKTWKEVYDAEERNWNTNRENWSYIPTFDAWRGKDGSLQRVDYVHREILPFRPVAAVPPQELGVIDKASSALWAALLATASRSVLAEAAGALEETVDGYFELAGGDCFTDDVYLDERLKQSADATIEESWGACQAYYRFIDALEKALSFNFWVLDEVGP